MIMSMSFLLFFPFLLVIQSYDGRKRKTEKRGEDEYTETFLSLFFLENTFFFFLIKQKRNWELRPRATTEMLDGVDFSIISGRQSGPAASLYWLSLYLSIWVYRGRWSMMNQWRLSDGSWMTAGCHFGLSQSRLFNEAAARIPSFGTEVSKSMPIITSSFSVTTKKKSLPGHSLSHWSFS